MDEKAIIDYGEGKADFESLNVKGINLGIRLKSFELDGKRWSVLATREYKPWNFGCVNPGAGQIGKYVVCDEPGKYFLATIKDYRAIEGDWRIFLIGKMTPTDLKLEELPFGEEISKLPKADVVFPKDCKFPTHMKKMLSHLIGGGYGDGPCEGCNMNCRHAIPGKNKKRF